MHYLSDIEIMVLARQAEEVVMWCRSFPINMISSLKSSKSEDKNDIYSFITEGYKNNQSLAKYILEQNKHKHYLDGDVERLAKECSKNVSEMDKHYNNC